MKDIIKLCPNRVRRNYIGGKGIDLFRGSPEGINDNRPEEWVGSLVEAVNTGMEPIENEGLSYFEENGKKILLRDWINQNRLYYLGKNTPLDGNPQMGFLLKILDSAMRLQVQVHPDREYACAHLNSKYGKLECYYILGVEDPKTASIWLGFQKSPGKEQWKNIIETQDLSAMQKCFQNIPVKTGDVWVVPGGMPHAIGRGITMLEIMEPSDLVVRCEFERNGIIVPEGARFMGMTLDDCLDIFDYKEYSLQDVQAKCNLIPRLLHQNCSAKIEELVDKSITKYFQVLRITLKRNYVWEKLDRAMILIVVNGNGMIDNKTFCRGESFFISAASSEVCFSGIVSTTEIIAIYDLNVDNDNKVCKRG